MSPQRGQKCPLAPRAYKEVKERGEEKTATATAAPPPESKGTKKNGGSGDGGSGDNRKPGRRVIEPDLEAITDELLRRWGRRFDRREVLGRVADDAAAGRYALEGLAAMLSVSPAVPAWPSGLEEAVAVHRRGAVRASMIARLTEIRALSLVRASHALPGRRAEVRFVDAAAGRLVMEEASGGQPAATAEDLRALLDSFGPDLASGPTGRTLRERLAAIEAGRPDPAYRPPDRTKIEITTPEALAEWTFAPDAPTLFDLLSEHDL